MDVLLILTIVSAVALALFFFGGQNAVWGGTTVGLIIGVIAGAIAGGVVTGLQWGFVIGTIVGIVAELMGMMPEAQALRGLLIAAANQVIDGVGQVPGKEKVAAFLRGYLAGRSVAEIAQELGVSREWCSRN